MPDHLAAAAPRRREALHRLFWDAEQGFFLDYDLDRRARSPHASLAGVLPLFVQAATPDQAERVEGVLRERFLRPGGLVTTALDRPSGQQWDPPNGWPPLQWLAVAGLRHYGRLKLAREVAAHYCALVERVYHDTGRLMEKYNVVDPHLTAGGGEYPSQDGFGWTNGVYLGLKPIAEGV